jgi:hypothetical protein
MVFKTANYLKEILSMPILSICHPDWQLSTRRRVGINVENEKGGEMI